MSANRDASIDRVAQVFNLAKRLSPAELAALIERLQALAAKK